MKNWSYHIGSIWAEQLKNRIHNGDTLVELAPGGTDKIGIGLSKLNWTGYLYLIEPEPLALRTTLRSYNRLLPNCEIIPIQSTLRDFHLEHFDMLLANHPLDDMVIGNALTTNQFNSFFSDHYKKPVDLTKALWDSLSMSDCQSSVRNTINEVVAAARRAKTTILSQYASYFFTSNGFTRPDDVAFEALKAISIELNGNLFRNHRWLIA